MEMSLIYLLTVLFGGTVGFGIAMLLIDRMQNEYEPLEINDFEE